MAKKKPIYKKFRHERGFIGLPRHVFESPAYRSLSLKARCLLDELQNLYRLGRNGRIVLSVERAAKNLNACNNTAKAAFEELQAKGFIVMNLDSDHTKGRAREWRLTYEPCQGREPTDEWKDWKSLS
ncbi:MAG: hypothetical protein EOM12_13865 [Verrucomicrobiae bacterium]|nr:hypothetical protein [Verrucomicrobiae bacterium]